MDNDQWDGDKLDGAIADGAITEGDLRLLLAEVQRFCQKSVQPPRPLQKCPPAGR